MSEAALTLDPTPEPIEAKAASLRETLQAILRKLADEKLMDGFLSPGEPRQKQDLRGAVRYLHFAMRRFGPLETRLKAAETMAKMSQRRPALVAWAELLEQAGDKENAAKVARIALTMVYDDVHTQKLFLRCGGGEDFHAKAKDRFCPIPFENFEIYEDGSVHVCNCIAIPFPVGNVFKQSIEEIWQSPQAQAIRASMLDGSFKFCSPMGCWKRSNLPKRAEHPEEFERLKKIGVSGKEMPKNLNLSYDRSCNVSCPSCRNELLMAGRERREKLDIVRDKFVLPLLADKSAGQVYITGSGDAFGSPHFRGILKELCDPRYAHVKIDLGTNGQLITPRLWEEFQPLHARFSRIAISIDGAVPATYERLRRGSTWEKLENSMGVLKRARQENKIGCLVVNMVVQKDNFREMRLLLELCKGWAVDRVRLFRIRQWGHTKPDSYDGSDVSNPLHPQHHELMDEFSDPLFLDPIVDDFDLSELITKAHKQKTAETKMKKRTPAPMLDSAPAHPVKALPAGTAGTVTALSPQEVLQAILRKLTDDGLMDRFLPPGEPRQKSDIRGAVRYLHEAMRKFGPLETRLLAAAALAQMSGHRAALVAWAELLELSGNKVAAVKAAQTALGLFADDAHTQALVARCGGAPVESPKAAVATPSPVTAGYEGVYEKLKLLRSSGFVPGAVLDVGASTGVWSHACVHVFPEAAYALVEALPQCHATMMVNPQGKPWNVLPVALGPQVGEVEMFLPAEGYGAYEASAMEDGSQVRGKKIKVPQSSIDCLVAEGRLALPDLVKLDVQGYELHVLAGADCLWGKTEVFIVETSLYRFWPNAPRLIDVINFFDQKGYFVFDYAGEYRPNPPGRLRQIDLIFIRKQGALALQTKLVTV